MKFHTISKNTTAPSNPLAVRIIGDSILQNQGTLLPHEPTPDDLANLKIQVQIAKDLLIKTGGAGIAANQCAAIVNPYQFTIVGVYQENLEHKENLEKRYPGVNFPEAVLMINPRVIQASSEVQFFRHGCLSVPGGLRADMPSPKFIEVEYETLVDDQLVTHRKKYENVDAVVLQHELNHILFGKTYVDVCLENLSIPDKQTLKELIESVLENNQDNTNSAAQSSNIQLCKFIYKDDANTLRLDIDNFKLALSSTGNTVLQGLLARISSDLKLSDDAEHRAILQL